MSSKIAFFQSADCLPAVYGIKAVYMPDSPRAMKMDLKASAILLSAQVLPIGLRKIRSGSSSTEKDGHAKA